MLPSARVQLGPGRGFMVERCNETRESGGMCSWPQHQIRGGEPGYHVTHHPRSSFAGVRAGAGPVANRSYRSHPETGVCSATGTLHYPPKGGEGPAGCLPMPTHGSDATYSVVGGAALHSMWNPVVRRPGELHHARVDSHHKYGFHESWRMNGHAESLVSFGGCRRSGVGSVGPGNMPPGCRVTSAASPDTPGAAGGAPASATAVFVGTSGPSGYLHYPPRGDGHRGALPRRHGQKAEFVPAHVVQYNHA